MNRTAQNILYLVILAIIAIVLFIVAPHYRYNTHGIYLSTTQQQYQPVPVNTVQLYSAMPTGAEVIGTIRTMQHFGSTDKTAMTRLQESAVHYARQQAAQHGANGVVISELGRTTTRGPLDGVILYAKAIRT